MKKLLQANTTIRRFVKGLPLLYLSEWQEKLIRRGQGGWQE